MTRVIPSILVSAGLAVAQPVVAQQAGAPPTDRAGRAEAIATQPLADANIKKLEVPPVLQRIAADPYAVRDLKTCAQLAAAVAELDAVLSPDVDAPAAPAKGDVDKAIDTVGAVAGSLVPFGGVLREVSGANKARRAYALAILNGYARRSFLKGVGFSRGCHPPAAPR